MGWENRLGRPDAARKKPIIADNRANDDAPRRSYEQPELNDIGNAEHFAKLHGDRLKYVHAWNKWLVWDGCRWKLDDDGTPLQLAKQTVRDIFHDGVTRHDQHSSVGGSFGERVETGRDVDAGRTRTTRNRRSTRHQRMVAELPKWDTRFADR